MWGFAKINSLVVNIICTVYSWNKYSTIIIILLLTVCIDPFTPFYTIYFGRLIACVFLYGPHESRDRLCLMAIQTFWNLCQIWQLLYTTLSISNQIFLTIYISPWVTWMSLRVQTKSCDHLQCLKQNMNQHHLSINFLLMLLLKYQTWIFVPDVDSIFALFLEFFIMARLCWQICKKFNLQCMTRTTLFFLNSILIVCIFKRTFQLFWFCCLE